MFTTTCKRCGAPFQPKRPDQQFHSNACRQAAYRQRLRPPVPTEWLDRAPQLSVRSRGDGSLTRAELGWRLVEIAGDDDDDGQPKTGRRFYYLALSHGFIVVDMSDSPEGKRSRDSGYKRVTEILGILRMNGELDWTAVLDLTRELDEWRMYGSPREARAQLRRNYDEDRWLGQAFYPVLIVEKDTLEPICRPLAGRWQMPFSSSRGYGSLKLQHDVADALRRRYAQTNQPAVVLFISDLDPSGLDLQRAWREALENFGAPVTDFVRIGLTLTQVDALANPRLRQGIEVKPSDSRARSYVAEYGGRCWETDILPATTIEQAINEQIRARLDIGAWQRRHEEIERARRLL
jgi:hypothetical protein